MGAGDGPGREAAVLVEAGILGGEDRLPEPDRNPGEGKQDASLLVSRGLIPAEPSKARH